MNAILLHGSCDKEEYFDDKYPSLSNSHWFPWLQKQLLIKGINVQTPEILDAYQPEYSKWTKEFERFEVGENTILVGHSCGGGFLVRWLSENKIKVKNLVLVAPWLDPSNRKTGTFFDFEIDPSISARVEQLHIFVSANDDTEGVQESVERLIKVFPSATVRHFEKLGHFTYEEMGTEKFPELLEVIL